ncbi:MAG TPA: serpin family protein [Clostridiaceae bacterium]|nr:serpin family protein [Clostridiaceae bacterium]
MKKRVLCFFICVVLAASLIAGCDMDVKNLVSSYDTKKIDKSIIEGNTQFAFDIFKLLNEEDSGKNVFISPLSISSALAMTYNGAGTTTKDGMAKALRYEGIEMEDLNTSFRGLTAYLNSIKDVRLNVANSIWIKEGEEIQQEFLSTNKKVFSAHIEELDFSKADSADKINKWISNATKGKIDKMLEPPIPSDVIMYLINAIYFKGQWREKFNPKMTQTSKFHTEDGRSEDVEMMYRNGKAEFGTVEGNKVVRLPYGKGKIAMYCVLPDEGVKIDDFIKSLNAGKWNVIRNSVSEMEEVILKIPKFKMEYGIKELNESLKALGMEEAFNNSADFSGIGEGVYISSVIHKAVIEVNEEGSEAAGVTVVEMTKSAAPEPMQFIADRPFLFVIADDETGSILFMGKMCDVN